MLKKKFFIHLFFSKESQYDILAVGSKGNPEVPVLPGQKTISSTSLIYNNICLPIELIFYQILVKK
jgi:hypothetical protein